MIKRVALLALILTCLPAASNAQTLSGTITGTVADAQGAVLPGVTVTLTGRTGSQTTVSNDSGEFRFVGLNPGPYSLRAELTGFRTSRGTDPRSRDRSHDYPARGVAAGNRRRDRRGRRHLAHRGHDDHGHGHDDFTGPAVQHADLADQRGGQHAELRAGRQQRVGVRRARRLRQRVDARWRGHERSRGWHGMDFFNYNLMDEVQVGALGQPAEYGGFTGAVVNTITKSGGNRYSSLFEYRYTEKGLARRQHQRRGQARRTRVWLPRALTSSTTSPCSWADPSGVTRPSSLAACNATPSRRIRRAHAPSGPR